MNLLAVTDAPEVFSPGNVRKGTERLTALGTDPAPLPHQQRAAQPIGPDLHPVEALHVFPWIDTGQARLLGEEGELGDRCGAGCRLGALERHGPTVPYQAPKRPIPNMGGAP
jgi:hypothetical protein